MKTKNICVIGGILILLIGCIGVFASTLSGGTNNTVENSIIAQQPYKDKDTLENAVAPSYLEAGSDVYASISLIETPAGSEYTGNWYLDGQKIKSEIQKTVEDCSDILIFKLEANKIQSGNLSFDILCHGDVLLTKEIVVQ